MPELRDIAVKDKEYRRGVMEMHFHEKNLARQMEKNWKNSIDAT